MSVRSTSLRFSLSTHARRIRVNDLGVILCESNGSFYTPHGTRGRAGECTKRTLKDRRLRVGTWYEAARSYLHLSSRVFIGSGCVSGPNGRVPKMLWHIKDRREKGQWKDIEHIKYNKCINIYLNYVSSILNRHL